jgi:hypothetical protein
VLSGTNYTVTITPDANTNRFYRLTPP